MARIHTDNSQSIVILPDAAERYLSTALFEGY
jgi:hypothetical protein